jgi:nucleoside 2-deoxyribosyltransferase
MKFFIAFKFTGEEQEKIRDNLKKVCSALEELGHSYYCTFFDEGLPKEDIKDLFNHAFEKLENSDIILVLVNSNEPSEGMLMEIGYALAKGKRVILAIDKGIGTTKTRDLIDEIIEFEDFDDLAVKLNEIK